MLPESFSEQMWGDDGGLLIVRHAERPSFGDLLPHERFEVALTSAGRDAAMEAGGRLGPGLRILASPVKRSFETARLIAEGAGLGGPVVTVAPPLTWFKNPGQPAYEAAKQRLGWPTLIERWLADGLPEGVLPSCRGVAEAAVRGAMAAAGSGPARVVAVAHDYMVSSLLATFFGHRTVEVPFLAGVLLTGGEVRGIVGSGEKV